MINDFRTGKLYALICTDLMARGIDFKGKLLKTTIIIILI